MPEKKKFVKFGFAILIFSLLLPPAALAGEDKGTPLLFTCNAVNLEPNSQTQVASPPQPVTPSVQAPQSAQPASVVVSTPPATSTSAPEASPASAPTPVPPSSRTQSV